MAPKDPVQSWLQSQPSSSLIKDIKYLTDEYIPSEIPFRNKQIMAMLTRLGPMAESEDAAGTRIFITGPSGTGKTVCAFYVKELLEAKAKKLNVPLHTAYVNCANTPRRYAAYTQILHDFGGNGVRPGWQEYRLIEAFKKMEGPKVVFVDEAERYLATDETEQLFYVLSRTPQTGIVVISANFHIYDMFRDAGVKSSMAGQHIGFEAYKADEITRIIMPRVELAFNKPPSLAVLSAIATKAADLSGNARYALRLLRYCAELAREKGTSTITVEIVDEADRMAQQRETVAQVSKLQRHAKLLFKSVVDCFGPDGEMRWDDVYDRYRELAGENFLLPRRARDLLKELQATGMIDVSGKRHVGTTIRLLEDLATATKAVENLH